MDNTRTTAEENINELLENFMGINDAELGRKEKDSEEGEQNEKDDNVKAQENNWKMGKGKTKSQAKKELTLRVQHVHLPV